MSMSKRKQCEAMWNKFEEIKRNAEQHQFVAILKLDLQFTPLYTDLMKNWDEHHADLFIKGFPVFCAKYGFNILPCKEE